MNALLLIGAIEALFLAVLIIARRRKLTLSDRLLLTWVLIAGFMLVAVWMSFGENTPGVVVPIAILAASTPYLHGPLIFFYAQSVLVPDWHFRPIHLLHFLPFVVDLLLFMTFYISNPNDVAVKNGVFIVSVPFPPMFGPFEFLQFASAPIYSMAALYSWKAIYWLRNFLSGLLVGTTIIFLLTPGIFAYQILSIDRIFASMAFVFVVLIFYTGYILFKQQGEVILQNGDRYKKSSLSSDDSLGLLEKLLDHVERTKPWLDGSLTLHRLAADLSISPNHLSQVINSRLNKNFFQFINEYRIREFEERMNDPKYESYTLEGTALECGFRSRSAFFDAFKKIKGESPRQYLRSK